jgi:hypothetical protein
VLLIKLKSFSRPNEKKETKVVELAFNNAKKYNGDDTPDENFNLDDN